MKFNGQYRHTNNLASLEISIQPTYHNKPSIFPRFPPRILMPQHWIRFYITECHHLHSNDAALVRKKKKLKTMQVFSVIYRSSIYKKKTRYLNPSSLLFKQASPLQELHLYSLVGVSASKSKILTNFNYTCQL